VPKTLKTKFKKKEKQMPNQPISGNDLARFAGPQTFMRLPYNLQTGAAPFDSL